MIQIENAKQAFAIVNTPFGSSKGTFSISIFFPLSSINFKVLSITVKFLRPKNLNLEDLTLPILHVVLRGNIACGDL